MIFFVPGLPQQQGTKTKWGTEENPHVTGWRESVANVAHAMLADAPLYHGPVRMECVFYFPRPKAHYRGGKFSAELKKDAPVYHASPPDLDKLVRAIGDALTATVLHDDRQIANLSAFKLYTSGSDVGVRVTVEPIVPAQEALL
jgi:crossover junction endodeoxyribonuclease RusA